MAGNFVQLQAIADNPNVPDAIRTSARDQINQHMVNAKKAGVSPFEYKGGGEPYEMAGDATPKSREERTASQSSPMGANAGTAVASPEDIARAKLEYGPPAQPLSHPPGMPGAPPPAGGMPSWVGAETPADRVGGLPPGPQEGFLATPEASAAPPPISLPQMAVPQPDPLPPGLPPWGAPDTVGQLPLPPEITGRPAPPPGLPPPEEMPPPEPPRGGMPSWVGAPSPADLVGLLPPGNSGQDFPLATPQPQPVPLDKVDAPIEGTPLDPVRWARQIHEFGQELGARMPWAGAAAEANAKESQTFPLTPPKGIDAVAPVEGAVELNPPSKPEFNPPSKPAEPEQPVPLPVSKPAEPIRTAPSTGYTPPLPPTRPGMPDGSDAAPASQGIDGARKTADGGGGAVGGMPTFKAAEPEAAASGADPSSLDFGFGSHRSLGLGLMSAGFAMMASRGNLAQALGEGGQTGIQTYEKATSDEARQKALADELKIRQQAETRATYRDTELEPYVKGQELKGQAETRAETKRSNDLSYDVQQGRLGIDKDRLGIEGQRVGLEGRRIGLEGARVGLEGQRMGLEREQLDIARQNLAPADVRTLDSLMTRFEQMNPGKPKSEYYDLAMKEYLQLHPPPASYGLLNQLGGTGGLGIPTDQQLQ
jgi:hypothetical protein